MTFTQSNDFNNFAVTEFTDIVTCVSGLRITFAKPTREILVRLRVVICPPTCVMTTTCPPQVRSCAIAKTKNVHAQKHRRDEGYLYGRWGLEI